MPITIGPADSATIGTAEYFLASDSTVVAYQTTDCILQAFIDFNAMAAGDQYQVKVYEKVDGTNARPIYSAVLSGAQSAPFVTPAFVVGAGWEIGVTKLAGTDRSIAWSLNTVS